MERVTLSLSLSRSLIWSLVGLEQLHTSRDRVQRERKNLLSCPADTFKSYQSKEGAWKESRVARKGAAIGPDWHERAALQRCRVRPTSAKRGRHFKVQDGGKLSLDEVQSQGDEPQSRKSSPSLQSVATISCSWDQNCSTGPMIAIYYAPTCGWCLLSSKARNITSAVLYCGLCDQVWEKIDSAN